MAAKSASGPNTDTRRLVRTSYRQRGRGLEAGAEHAFAPASHRINSSEVIMPVAIVGAGDDGAVGAFIAHPY